MGTRCLTVLHDSDDSEIAVLYRQCDGYPDGHGKELANFLKGKIIVNGISGNKTKIFNGMGCVAASVIAHFKNGVGSFYLYPAGTRDQWEDYIYHVRGEVGKEPEIEIEGEFVGPASDFNKFYTFDSDGKSNSEIKMKKSCDRCGFVAELEYGLCKDCQKELNQ